jgi:bifunctional non-homologous end joining protein LigD
MSVTIHKPDKVLFPDAGVTKADLAAYYERVAERMLPQIKGRPISMQRFPDGIGKRGFFHKEVPAHFPDWIKRVEVPKQGGTVTHAIAWDVETLRYLVDQACITPHVWLSRAVELERPDRLVFDLDPSDDSFAAVRRTACRLGELLRELGLVPYAMTTGSRGLHVWVPLRPKAGFDEVRAFARRTAELMVRRDPETLTIESRKNQRGGRIFLDVLRNGYAQTAVAPYAVRARASAPVAMPLHWEELSDSRLRPDKFTTRNAGRRLSSSEDPWKDIARHARALDRPGRALERLADKAESAAGGL